MVILNRNKRKIYEKHLSYFYEYTIDATGRGTNYIFTKQHSDYIPYKEYANSKKTAIIEKNIHETIRLDNRQTGSNIARIRSST